MPKCTWVSRAGRGIFRIKSYEKAYSSRGRAHGRLRLYWRHPDREKRVHDLEDGHRGHVERVGQGPCEVIRRG